MKKLFKILRMFFEKGNQFNFKVAFYWMFSSVVPNKKNNIKKHQVINDFLSKNFINLIEKHKNKQSQFEGEKSNYVWIFWWQGEELAPEIVKKNLEKLKCVFKDKNVVLISEENLSDYVNLPDFITEKFKQNLISITHLSDIVRIKLLKKYGGLWLDACIIPHGENTCKLFENEFFTIKQDEDENCKYVSRGRWIIGVFSTDKKNPLFDFLSDFYDEYWMKYNCLIDYFLFDYAISLANNHFEVVREMIDKLEKSNSNIYALTEKGNEKFDLYEFDLLAEDTFLFRLPWRTKYFNEDENGDLTYYRFLTSTK